MKKHLLKTTAALSAATLLLSACASAPEPPEFDPENSDLKMTVSQLYSESTDEAILKEHENYYVIVNVLGDRYTEYGYFRTKDLFFYEYFKPKTRKHNVDYYYNGGRWYMDYSDDASPVLEYRWYAMDDDEMRSMIFSGDALTPVDPDTPDKERIFDIAEDAKGQPCVYTTENRETVKDLREKYKLSDWRFNGARYDHKYTLDKETGELKFRSDYLTLASGKSYRFYDIEMLYDVNIPDFLKMVTMVIEGATNDESAEKVTLTAVYDDGQTYSVQYNGNYKVSLIPKAGYTAYTDAQRSAVFDGYLPYKDTTVYLFRE